MGPFSALAIAGAGTAAGFINVVVGSGTLITFPTLLAVGYSPLVANVSNTIGLVPGSLSGAHAYRKELTGQRRRGALLGSCSSLGAVIGAFLLLELPGNAFRRVVPFLILIACVLVAFQPTLSRWLAPSDRPARRFGHRGQLLYVAVFATGIYGGYFGAAQGVILISLLAIFINERLQRLNAMKNVLVMLANLVSGVIFALSGHVSWEVVGILAVGSTVGGQIGGRFGRRLPQRALRVAVVVVGTAVAVVLLVERPIPAQRSYDAPMKLDLHISDFTWQGGAPKLASKLGEVARLAEDVGFDRISVMDHVWQIGHLGPPEHEMLEAYTTLGYLAAATQRAKLMTIVTASTYRTPGLLAKIVSTLDVLSSGRAWLGIGAAWNEDEALGLGLFFPPLAERYERLEEILQICLQMWSDEDGPYKGQYYNLARTLNSPQTITRPHPPIMIGWAGEKKTLKLVARYAQACNIFGTTDVAHKLEVLRAHCETEGRSYDEIEKGVITRFDVGERGERAGELVEELQKYSALGVQAVSGTLARVSELTPLEVIGKEVIPAIADL